MGEASTVWLQRIIFFASVWVAWEIVCRYGAWPAYLLPAPSQVVLGLWEGIVSGLLIEAVALSLKRAAFAFGVAFILGVVLGLLLAESR